MNTQDVAALRQKAGLSQAALAQALGFASRTVAAWEATDPPRVLSEIESRALRGIFRTRILEDRLVDMCEQAFSAVPSELVAIWIVEGSECVLLPRATRYQDLQRGTRRDIYAQQSTAQLAEESLTSFPLRTGETLNLAGDAILHHKAKKYKGNRAHHNFQAGICESLLHVPAFTPSPRGPSPVLLLSLENKVTPNGEVIKAKPGELSVYSDSECDVAKKLAAGFSDTLLPDLELLGMRE